MHIGSQLFRIDPYVDGVERLDRAARRDPRATGIDTLEYLDIGGGLGVSLRRRAAAGPRALRRALLPTRRAPTGLTLLMEPGRFIVGNAGVLLTRVLYRKHSGGRDFLITDAGMTELHPAVALRCVSSHRGRAAERASR